MFKFLKAKSKKRQPPQPQIVAQPHPEDSSTEYENSTDEDEINEYDYPEVPIHQNLEPQPTDVDAYELAKSLESESNWERGACIGCGTMSKVFAMSNVNTGAKCVAKVVGFNSAEKQMPEMMKGCHILMGCEHPCIVKFLNYTINYREREIKLFMESMQSNLKSYIADCGNLSEGEATHFCQQILEGLQYLHDKNIMHRDIKSSNVLLGNSRCVKISDFGISKHCTNIDITKTKTACIGTYYYMAPEVIFGRYCCKADVWSVGCTLVEMLCGTPPNSSMDHVQVIFYVGQTKKANYTLPSDTSARMASFISLLLAPESSTRPDVRSALQHRIFGEQLTQLQYIDYYWVDSGFVAGAEVTD